MGKMSCLCRPALMLTSFGKVVVQMKTTKQQGLKVGKSTLLAFCRRMDDNFTRYMYGSPEPLPKANKRTRKAAGRQTRASTKENDNNKG